MSRVLRTIGKTWSFRYYGNMARLILILVSSLCFTSCIVNKSDDKAVYMTDCSINQFVLRDTSLLSSMNIPNMIDDLAIGEFIGFSNVTSSEYLLLIRENGGCENQFNYFYLTDSIPVEYLEKLAILPDSVFLTTRGVHIGSSEKEFCNKYKGIDFSISQNGTYKTYEFQDTVNLYYSTYQFKQGYLAHIEFGYVW